MLHQTAHVHDYLIVITVDKQPVTLRLIEVLYHGRWHRDLTNELDPTRLPVFYVVALYWQRWRIEQGTRFRKQELNWTLPQFHTPEAGDRWSHIVCLAFWLLYLARPLVQDLPLPWQPKQTHLTPARVRQEMTDIFAQIGCPTRPVQSRGKSPGWPTGKLRQRRARYKIVKKMTKPPNSTQITASYLDHPKTFDKS